jgi:NADH:ubiquinone oxidoreductase subunit F (NADH-binding)
VTALAPQVGGTQLGRVSVLGEPRLLRGFDLGQPVRHADHVQLHGPLPLLDATTLTAWCDAVRLTGRGGAAFPVARKLRALRGGHRVVVVNGCESEPASIKDRTLLTRFPHLVLDGAVLVADAIAASEIRIAVHDQRIAQDLWRACGERPDTGRVHVDMVSASFVSGEATALVQGLNGNPALPLGRRVLPTDRGVNRHATFLSNTETYAQLAVLARAGVDQFVQVGTRDEPGTMLLSVGGAVANPSVIEAPYGTFVADVLRLVAAQPPTALVVGGYHGGWVPPKGELRLTRAALTAVGATLGAGVVLVVDDRTCALGELTRVASWLAAQSVQQCGPCRFGLSALVNDLVAAGHGRNGAESALHRHTTMVTGRGACAHPDGAARFVSTGVRLLHRELDQHRRRRGCGRPVYRQLPVPGVA